MKKKKKKYIWNKNENKQMKWTINHRNKMKMNKCKSDPRIGWICKKMILMICLYRILLKLRNKKNVK